MSSKEPRVLVGALVSEEEWTMLTQAVDLMPEREGALKPYFKSVVTTLRKHRNRYDIRRLFGEEKGHESRRLRFNDFLKSNSLPFVLSRFALSRGLYDAGLIRLGS